MVRADHRVPGTPEPASPWARGMDGARARAGDLDPGRGGGLLEGRRVCADLANRGVQDVLIVCCDGPAGPPEAVEATWPDSMVPTCVVHLIRASMRFVAYGEGKGVAAALRPSLHRPRRGGRPTGPRRLPPVRPGPQVPPDGGDVGEGLGEVHPLPGLPPGRAPGHLCTTNAIESLNPLSRAVRREPRPLLSSDEAAVKLLWPAGLQHPWTAGPRSAPRRRTRPPTRAGPTGGLVEGQVTTNWKQALAQLAAAYPDRINPHL